MSSKLLLPGLALTALLHKVRVLLINTQVPKATTRNLHLKFGNRSDNALVESGFSTQKCHITSSQDSKIDLSFQKVKIRTFMLGEYKNSALDNHSGYIDYYNNINEFKHYKD